MSDNGDSGDDPVGYGNPPKHTQFKPGKSGNPKGRPPGSGSMKLAAYALYSTPIPLKENGKLTECTYIEAVMKRIMSDALKGRPTAQRLIVEIGNSIEGRWV